MPNASIRRSAVGSLVVLALAVIAWSAVAQAGPTPTPTASPTAAPPPPPGSVVGWGWDVYGGATPPDAVNGVSGTASDIAAGDAHSCAIQAGTGHL